MNIERALATEGWCSEEELTHLATLVQRKEMVLEIGSWKGRSACALAANCPGIVFCVDTWQGKLQANYASGIDREFLNTFLENTKEFKNIWPVPMDSIRAASMMLYTGLRFDVIFIDADHDYEKVKTDILTWRPLLNDRGVLCGHDYEREDWPGVKKAVKELIPAYQVIDSLWVALE